jgi:WD40 repeat protein
VYDVPGGKRLLFEKFPLLPDAPAQVGVLALAQVHLAFNGRLAAAVSRVDPARGLGAALTEVQVWDLGTGKRLLHQSRPYAATSLSFDASGRWLAVADWTIKAGQASVLDSRTGGEVRTIRGHSRAIQSVAFSRGGDRLATAGADGLVKVWDAATGREVITLRGHKGPVAVVRFSPDGRRLVSGSGGVYIPGQSLGAGSEEGANSAAVVKVWDAGNGAQVRP